MDTLANPVNTHLVKKYWRYASLTGEISFSIFILFELGESLRYEGLWELHRGSPVLWGSLFHFFPLLSWGSRRDMRDWSIGPEETQPLRGKLGVIFFFIFYFLS